MKKVILAVMVMALCACAMATNGDWTYIRIGTTNQGLEVRDGAKTVKVDSQKIDVDALKTVLKLMGTLQ